MTDPRPTPDLPPHRAAIFWPLLFAAIFAALLLTHLPLLDLAFYWDEAGYFVPAARDVLLTGDPVPHSTLSNAHPPLVPAYLALAWKLFGYGIVQARVAMLAVAALTLLGVFRLAERVANPTVAAAATLCTALYSVFFAQGSLAHLDMAVAALTVWGLVLYLPRDVGPKQDEDSASGTRSVRGSDGSPFNAAPASEVGRARGDEKFRRGTCVLLFALAGLAKETAILVPLTLFGWELLCALAGRKWVRADALCLGRWRSLVRPFMLLLALTPLALWFAYHYVRTGYVFGNPEYFRYNVESTVNLPRILKAFGGRIWHVTLHLNLWALTLTAALSMFLKPRRAGGRELPRIAVPVQLIFGVLVLAHVVALSIVGGAVLARYLLPVYPLVIIICVSTIWRRVRLWPAVVVLVCAAFVNATLFAPPYSIPWEENLTYRDFIRVHEVGARFLATRHPRARVLTAWPATDELTNPHFGYLERKLSVVPLENFMRENLEEAARRKSDYDLAFVFTTHGGPTADEAAEILGGRIIFREARGNQWVAIVEPNGTQ